MDTGEAGAAQQQQAQRQAGEKVVRLRGKSSNKQVRCLQGAVLCRRQWQPDVSWRRRGCAHHTRAAASRCTLQGRCPAPQKQRKRKSLEKALAVASRKETKVAKTSARKDGKKGLKKLWTNDSKADK